MLLSASGGQKNIFWQMLTFCWILYRPPFTDEGQIWCAIVDPRCTLTRQMSSRSVYSVALCWRKTPIFAVFWTRHLVLSPTGSSLTKLNTGAQLQTSPIQRHQNRFCTPTLSWQNRAQILWRSKAWWTKRQATCGAPQGSVLGPLLFLIYVNDIGHVLPNKTVKLFADNTNIFYISSGYFYD